MAASMKVLFAKSQTYFRACVNIRCAIIKRSCHSSGNADKPDQMSRLPRVGMSADGRTLIAWHPEPEHPYEHTQPLEYNMKEAEEGSVLKDQLIRNYETRYRATGPNIPELSNITFTTKHRWLPKPERKYMKRNPPKDRDTI